MERIIIMLCSSMVGQEGATFVAELGSHLMEKPAKSAVAADIGAWEKHTKGIGLKLLQKFGFNGRLGANENGVSRAIEVVVRPNNTGLGFGDIKEAASLKVNKKIEAEWRGVEFVDEEEEKKVKKSSVEKLAEGKGWKKNKTSEGVTKLNAADFINKYMGENAGAQKPQQVIIDMRHKDTRVITDMNEVGTEGLVDEIPADAKPKLGQELLYNINMIANAEEMNVTRDSKALARVVLKIKTLNEDKVQLQRATEKESVRLARLQKILLILSRVEEKLSSMQLLSSFTADGNAGNAGGDKVSLSSVCGVLRTLHQNFSEEFQIFGLINLLPNLISRVAVIDSWEPFTQYGDLCDMYDSLLPLVEYFESADELQLARQVRKAFADIVELRYLPIVRRAVASAWDPTTEPESCVRLMEALRLVLTTTTFDTTVDMYLVPKLTATVASWRPTLAADAPGIHTWLFPWLPLLTSKLSVLYPEIRRKFGTLLSNMACSDAPGVVAMLLPWVNVFDSSSFENLLVRSALPKLVTFLRGVEINPAQQEIAPVECTLAWCSLTPALPVTHLVCLWVGEFFPKWLRVLYAWLRADGTDFGEVSMWYTGWKGLFPESLLAEEKVTECFALALEMMQTSLGAEGEEGETAMLAFDAVLRRMENDDYYSLIEQHKTLQRAQKRLDILQAEESSSHYLAGAGKTGMPGMTGMAAPASYKQVTFKEVVETYAMRNNVEFVPKMGRLYEGKQLWQFGKSLCFLDQNVVFVSTAEKGGKRSAPGGGGAGADGADGGASRQELYGWAPIALEDLLQLSK